ncbi:uncharacterized protein LOC104454796 [Eucalyptus grandis]|uniref:uncharacterized protein LOC104454796 n=1 Tax=Eucalyptus grandis TaxID=71139 RepID=UPI00192E785B|nr:uncharacterized protein LOC104454796 [Eucalyptus grandis]
MGDEGSNGGDGGGGGGGREVTSPSNKVKFLCSHGGKILPRPATSDLMKKLSAQIDSDVVLKYQVAQEDLDALVSVRSDEDLRHMLDEYDAAQRREPEAPAFLFPANPTVVENQTAALEPQTLEQRYVDTIIGIVRTIPNVRLAPLRVSCAGFSISSAWSSPKSPSPDSGRSTDATAQETFTFNGRWLPMTKVESNWAYYFAMICQTCSIGELENVEFGV